jgi:sterol desaturase/sphingolipid hydroxylase (fatty acid hydroxylase superfamily)
MAAGVRSPLGAFLWLPCRFRLGVSDIVHDTDGSVGNMVGLSLAQGHTGFDRAVTGPKRPLYLLHFAHYLHHRLSEVNYADGIIPLDKWFRSFHDGSPQADEALKARRLKFGQRGSEMKENQ